MIERTLVLIKPDGVARSLVGRILSRFEDSGLKIVGMKMQWVNETFAKKHYTEDLAIRRGEAVRRRMVAYLQTGPILVLCLEGINAVEVVRKIVGSTEPKSAAPGTIRGDFAHVSYEHADTKDEGLRNLIHASGDSNDAAYEVPLWFTPAELHSYKSVHDAHIL